MMSKLITCPKCEIPYLPGEAEYCTNCGEKLPSQSKEIDHIAKIEVGGNVIRRAIPFVPLINSGNEAQQAARELSKLIKNNEVDGWRFCHLENITTVRNNGCLAALVGNPTTVLTIQVAIFEKG
jgi:hypothetical protein